MAVGASTGFTGSTKPLEAFERSLVGTSTQARSSMQRDLQGRLQQMARAAGVRMPTAREARAARARARDDGRRKL